MDAEGPLRLLGPTRLARVSPFAARALLLVLVAITAYGVAMSTSRELVDTIGRGEDPALYAAIVDDLRSGRGYYAATGMRLRERGYAMASVPNWRLPTLALVFAALPSDSVARGILGTLAMVTLLVWYAALRRATTPRLAFAMCLALLGVLGWPFLGEAYRVHETWAGIAIALSIASLALGRTTVGVLAGLGALSVRELALPYVLVAVVLAIRRRVRGEALAWLVGIAAFCAAYALHAAAVAHHQLPGDRAQAASWIQLGGWWFVLRTAMLNAWMMAAPPAMLAIVWPLSLLGLVAFPGSLGRRIAIAVLVYVGVFLFVGLPYNHLWGLLYAGLAPLGLFCAPAALRDLARQARPPIPSR